MARSTSSESDVGESGLVDRLDSGLVPERGVALVSGGPDSACAAAGPGRLCRPDVARRPAPQLRPARGLRRRRGDLPARSASSSGSSSSVERPDARGGQRPGRRPRRALRGRGARCGPSAASTGSRPATPAPTSPRPCSTGSRSRPGAGRCSGFGRAAGAWSGRCWRSAATRRGALATRAGAAVSRRPDQRRAGFARNRIRTEVLPVLRELSPAAERNIAETRAELAEEAEALEALGGGAARRRRRGRRRSQRSPPTRSPTPTRRCGASLCARSPSAPPGARSRSAARGPARSCASRDPEGGEVELGGGLRAVCEAGTSASRGCGRRAAEPAGLRDPGRAAASAHWEVRAELRAGPVEPRGPRASRRSTRPRSATSSSCAPGATATGCARSASAGQVAAGPVHRPRVPRSLRRSCRWSLAGERIAWVAGRRGLRGVQARARAARCRRDRPRASPTIPAHPI